MLDVGVITMPRGSDKAKLFENKQVITSFKLVGYIPDESLYNQLEHVFREIIDLSQPYPR